MRSSTERFWHRLAGHLGMSVARCKEEVSGEEFKSWLAFAELEPFGPLTDYERIGHLIAQILNAFGGGRLEASDFFKCLDRSRVSQYWRSLEGQQRLFDTYFGKS